MIRSRFLSLSILLTAAGCGADSTPDSSASALPTTTMKLGDEQFTLEKATTPPEQQVGLMHRDSMPPDHGMLFIFPSETQGTFWNHDVRFGLDNLFIGADGNIVSIQHMNAYDDTPTKPCTYRYVIELNTGVPAKLGLKVGDHLDIPADAAGN